MASLTNFTANLVLDALMRGVPFAPPQSWYVALVTTAGASNALAGVEVQGGSYARVAVPATLAAWAGTQGDGSTGISIGLGGNTSNNDQILFPNPSAGWGTIVGWEFWDAPNAGNRWLYDVLEIPVTVSVDDPAPSFPPAALAIQFV